LFRKCSGLARPPIGGGRRAPGEPWSRSVMGEEMKLATVLSVVAVAATMVMLVAVA